MLSVVGSPVCEPLSLFYIYQNLPHTSLQLSSLFASLWWQCGCCSAEWSGSHHHIKAIWCKLSSFIELCFRDTARWIIHLRMMQEEFGCTRLWSKHTWRLYFMSLLLRGQQAAWPGWGDYCLWAFVSCGEVSSSAHPMIKKTSSSSLFLCPSVSSSLF